MSVRHKAGEVEPNEGREEEADSEETRSGRTGSDSNTAERAGKSHDATTTEQASAQREVGQLGGGFGQINDTTRMADGGGSSGPECESTKRNTTARSFKGHGSGTEPRGGLEVGGEGDGGDVPGGESGGSRQKGVHLGGGDSRQNHCGAGPQRPRT